MFWLPVTQVLDREAFNRASAQRLADPLRGHEVVAFGQSAVSLRLERFPHAGFTWPGHTDKNKD